jgi:hypothetical protein
MGIIHAIGLTKADKTLLRSSIDRITLYPCNFFIFISLPILMLYRLLTSKETRSGSPCHQVGGISPPAVRAPAIVQPPARLTAGKTAVPLPADARLRIPARGRGRHAVAQTKMPEPPCGSPGIAGGLVLRKSPLSWPCGNRLRRVRRGRVPSVRLHHWPSDRSLP